MKSRLHSPLWALLCTGISACSPTYQSVYEGDVRFEHCYRVDEERAVPISDKLQCWRDWGHRYSYGQSRDRVGYAHARERTLSEALARGVVSAPRGTDTAPRMLPQPTNAFAPPPQTMKPQGSESHALASDVPTRTRPHFHEGEGDGGAGNVPEGAENDVAPSAGVALADAPGATCSSSCGKSWIECGRSCKANPCASTCNDRYRTCMRGCF